LRDQELAAVRQPEEKVVVARLLKQGGDIGRNPAQIDPLHGS
jgi:hypothetical protein